MSILLARQLRCSALQNLVLHDIFGDVLNCAVVVYRGVRASARVRVVVRLGAGLLDARGVGIGGRNSYSRGI